MSILRPIQLVYSLIFKEKCDIVVYKLTLGILIKGKFVMFLSTKYVEDMYGISKEDLADAVPTVKLTDLEIRKLVKKEKKTRIKLNLDLHY